MRCHTETDFVRFADQALPFLAHDPVKNNIAYTVVADRRHGGWPVEPDALWIWIQDDAGESVGLAIRTPPRPLLLTGMSTAAAHAIADHLATCHPRLDAVSGPVSTARDFARQWSVRTGENVEPLLHFRLFQLHQLIPPAPVPGHLREARQPDRAVLVHWLAAFNEEALPATAQPDPALAVDARLAYGGMLWLWEANGVPVAVLQTSLPAAGIVRISGVYTPPEHRRQGYASACVAAATQLALDRGATGCVLTTDLANPTSNHIYQAIGYRPVCDTQTWRLHSGNPYRRSA